MNNIDQAFVLLGSGNPSRVKRVLRRAILEGPGFEKLGKKLNISPKSLIRMVSTRGNPTLNNLTLILKALLNHNQKTLSVSLKNRPLAERRQRYLSEMAEKYFWWQRKNRKELSNFRILAQVMDLGEIQDTETLHALFEKSELRSVLKNAKPGWFHRKSWNYWNLLLNPTAPLSFPERKIP